MRLSVQIEFDKILDLNTAKTSVVVGRAADVSELVIPHNSVSRRHCKIELEQGIFFITDLKSSNGVTINGTRIPPMVKTKVPPKANLMIAKLHCDLLDKVTETDAKKIESQQINPDFTSTIRIARIDLERDILETREITKSPPKVKGPRNPITHMEPVKKKSSDFSFKQFFFLIVLIGAAILGILLYRSFKTL